MLEGAHTGRVSIRMTEVTKNQRVHNVRTIHGSVTHTLSSTPTNPTRTTHVQLLQAGPRTAKYRWCGEAGIWEVAHIACSTQPRTAGQLKISPQIFRARLNPYASKFTRHHTTTPLCVTRRVWAPKKKRCVELSRTCELQALHARMR